MGSDDTPEPDASRLTPEEKHGPRTIHVAVFLLAALLIVAGLTEPEAVLPRDSTLHGEHHADAVSGLAIPVPVGWRASSDSEFGSVQLVPTGSDSYPSTKIVAGRLGAATPAAPHREPVEAAEDLAGSLKTHLLGVEGTHDDRRTEEVSNDTGDGVSVSFVVVPTDPGSTGSGGLVYSAVFGAGAQRWWLGYVTASQGSAPGPRWVDRIVGGIQSADAE